VGRVVSIPHDYIWLHFVSNVCQHSVNGLFRKITEVGAPLLGLAFGLRWESVIRLATEERAAFLIGPDSIHSVQMRIAELHHSQSASLLAFYFGI
jgi:hypothetical protein